ncbi:MAG: c-type cytochrome [bacterium]
MPKLWNLALFTSLTLALSCGGKEALVSGKNAPVDTVTVAQEEVQTKEVTPLLDLTYAERKGKRLYDKYCAICHGSKGEGDGFNAYNLNPRPKDFTQEGYFSGITDAWLFEVISQGGRGVKRSILMPSYENTLSRQQIEDIVAYVRFLAK